MKQIKNCVAIAAATFVALVSLGCMTPAADDVLRADPNWDSAPADISEAKSPTHV
ncbi:hypothetical protein [Streptomyces sp. NPDC058486]|uniref:hypothetical protein n=1 Tax=unclassified Streptomyces TaxID=2593676 RepID=UPI0036674C65